MKTNTERKKVIGISLELFAITNALNGMRLLMEGDGSGSPVVLAILGLVVARLELLRRVVTRQVDPGVAWTEHSATVPEGEARETDDPEFRMEAWTEKRRAEKRRRHGRR